jgi:hypothetical protein
MTPTFSNPTTTSKTAALSTVEMHEPEVTAHPVDQRHAMISEAAFFIAQSRNFAPGNEFHDWLAAEHAVEQSLA